MAIITPHGFREPSKADLLQMVRQLQGDVAGLKFVIARHVGMKFWDRLKWVIRGFAVLEQGPKV